VDNPSDRKYQASHEWHKADGDMVTLGITRFAADELTDVTYVDLPGVGSTIKAGDAFGVVESVKATSDLISGIDGEVVEVNGALGDHPEYVNEDPFDRGWMIKVKAANPAQLDGLLSAADYTKQLHA
jgi:glycine cleavage system H protein